MSLELPAKRPRRPSRAAELVVPAGAAKSRKGKPNPNSAVVWDFQGEGPQRERQDRVQGADEPHDLARVAVADGLVFAPDFSGYLHCFDAKTGEHYWTHDTESAMWGSPMIADGKVFLCNEDGDVNIYPLSKKLDPDKDVITAQHGQRRSTARRCSPTARSTS